MTGAGGSAGTQADYLSSSTARQTAGNNGVAPSGVSDKNNSSNYRTSEQSRVVGSGKNADQNPAAIFNQTVKVVSGSKKIDGGVKLVSAGGYSRYGGGAPPKNVKQRPIDTTSIERP